MRPPCLEIRQTSPIHRWSWILSNIKALKLFLFLLLLLLVHSTRSHWFPSITRLLSSMAL